MYLQVLLRLVRTQVIPASAQLSFEQIFDLKSQSDAEFQSPKDSERLDRRLAQAFKPNLRVGRALKGGQSGSQAGRQAGPGNYS